MQPRRLLLQHAQLLLGQQQLLAGLIQLAHQLVVALLQLDVLHLGDVLLAVQGLVLLLQLEAEKRLKRTRARVAAIGID